MPEFALIVKLKVLSVILFDDVSILENIDKVLRGDLGEVVSDDDGSLVLSEVLDSFENEKTRGCVKSGSSLILRNLISG